MMTDAMIGRMIDEIEEAMEYTTNHEMMVYYRGVLFGLKYAKGEYQEDEQVERN